jgi:hypothetical protein
MPITSSRPMRRARACAHGGLALLFTATLAACGGGGGSADPGPAPPASPAPATTIAGTAATGAALAGAAVSLKCATGNGSATTASDGRYSIQISGSVAAPCVIQATLGATRLHSVVDSITSNSATANITPLSELIVARLAAADPAAFFAAFDAAAQARVTPGTVTQALSALRSDLQGVVDLNGIDPIHQSLVAANGTTPGNTLDQRLDALAAALTAARTTLAEVSSAATHGAPIATLVQPAAASCAGLRSGRYRVLSPSGDASTAVQVQTINAATLGVTFANTTTGQLTSQGACNFAVPGGGQLLVARSGIGVRRTQITGGIDTAVFLPEQTLALADLAGTWNALRFTRTSVVASYGADQSVFTLDAAGRFSNGQNCFDLAACMAWTTPYGDLTAAADGGFTFTTSGATVRVYGYKAHDGRIVLFGLLPQAMGFFVAAKQATLTLPGVGDTSNVWDYTVSSTGYAGVLNTVPTIVTAVNPAAPGSYTRRRTTDNRIDGFTLNTPRTGLRYRAAGSSAATTGTVSFGGIVVMPLGASIGITPYISVAQTPPSFGVSISQP